ncbi:phosphoglycerate mutase, putative [Plasmodium gallinaceum]|uniref:Phosphoglycerate mutase, putative n=1 Tax=Plasmodium gallinaceum TaxID=5849 RepID=A0A1J1GS61_PLAGA|nr:phosphoglycerate mutase, putative [Plasmodium gallinaceum]CRG95329.1 phosphoglycerate mutase, putative [Plasmodium gallinaceum]
MKSNLYEKNYHYKPNFNSFLLKGKRTNIKNISTNRYRSISKNGFLYKSSVIEKKKGYLDVDNKFKSKKKNIPSHSYGEYNYYNKENANNLNYLKPNYFNKVYAKYQNTKTATSNDNSNINYDYIFKKKNIPEKNMKYNDLIGDLYYKTSFYLKKNRKYMQRILKKNYVIKIYLVRHIEAQHNREVLKNPNIARDLIYKDIKFLDCGPSEEGMKICSDLKYDENKLYKKVIQLYNDSTQKSNINYSKKDKGAFEKNQNFIIISSPLRRCLETIKHFLNFKRNIIIHESVRETAGNYFSDERSKTSDIKKYCDKNFDDYELLCYGENDTIPGSKFRESSEQVYCRCLQFLKFIHSLSINYFSSIEKQYEEKDRNDKNGNNNTSNSHNENYMNGVNVDNKINKTSDYQNENGPNDYLEKYGKSKSPSIEENTCLNKKDGDGDELKENKNKQQNKKKDKKNVYNIVLVSHSSFILHLLALLDYLDLDARVLKNCEIKKIVIPLTNSFLFYNNVTNLQLSKPIPMNNIPLCFKNKNKILKKAYKDKHIYTINNYVDLDELICLQSCTVVIYHYDIVVKSEKNKKYLEKIQNFIDYNNECEKNVTYSNGIYKNFILKNKKMGRKILISDASKYLKYSEEKGVWEISKRGYFLGQNIIIIVLPDVETKTTKSNQNKNREEIKNKKNDKSYYLENVKQVVDNYDNVGDLIKSKDFWQTMKDNIKNLDLYSFQEYIIEKYNKIIKNEVDVCYIDLVGCIKNKNFMDKYENKCDGYLKALKEKYDKNSYIDFEQECKYINDNLIDKIFTEYVNNSDNNNKNSSENDIQNFIKRKFIYIPKKSHTKKNLQVNQSNIIDTHNKNFLQDNIKFLKSLPQSIQNLNVEMFYRDHYFYFHCLNKFIKSKNKIEGLVISKLLSFLDILKTYNTNVSNKIFQKLIKLEELIDKNTKEEGEKINTCLCEKKSVTANNTSYYAEGTKKYKVIQSLPGKKKSVVDDLNYLRYNLLTAAGGAENVYILNVLK